MRPQSFLGPAAFVLAVLAPVAAFAQESPDDDAIGTTPARSSKPAQAAPMAAPESSRQLVHVDATQTSSDYDESDDRESSRAHYRSGEAPLAADPPPDWAVLHAGLRPKLGTFAGIATFSLAHARTERFYGAFSLAGVRNDAGTHVGALQLALGRNLANDFTGGAQLSLTENRARNFVGIGQTSLAYNRSGEMVGVYQLAAFNRSKSFAGALQVGGYNRTDKSFVGLTQIGGYNLSRQDFTGAAQIGVVNAVGPAIFEEGPSDRRFAGIAQIGILDSASKFQGAAQIGAASVASREFDGIAQIGAFGAISKDFKGAAQIGALAMSERSIGLQIGAAGVSLEEHTGLQLGALGNWGKDVTGGQIGLVNVAREVKGVQIGLFNHARRLRGMQIGLANHADDGVLPWTAILNFGFGDDEDGPAYASARSSTKL